MTEAADNEVKAKAAEAAAEDAAAESVQAKAASRKSVVRLASAGAGLLVALVVVMLAFALMPGQGSLDPEREYGYVYSAAKSTSVAFADAAMDEGSLLMFGSSEFSTPTSIVPEVPAGTFATHDYGVHMFLVGEAFDQSLWQAIALGAHASNGVPRDKVVIIVGPGWFVDGGIDGETFKTRFSYALYSEFCKNGKLSEKTRAYVAERVASYGVDANTRGAAQADNPVDAVNGFVFGAIEDAKLRSQLDEVRGKGVEKVRLDVPEVPDFAAMRAQGLVDAQAKSTNNDWGLDDDFYAKQLEPALEGLAGARAGETYTDTPEYDDLACFLDIAAECGIEPLVVIAPVHGPYYDHIGIDAQTRAGCYDKIRALCAEKGAQVADFSDREYENYFLFDIVHFGWTGWVDVEQAIYEFAMGAGASGSVEEGVQ